MTEGEEEEMPAAGGGLAPLPEEPKEPPDISQAEIYLNNGADYTSDLSVKVVLKNIKNAEQMRINKRDDFTGVQWQDFKEEFSFEFLPGDGKKTVYLQFKSPKGVVSEKILSESIVLDTEGPAAPVNFRGKAEDSHIYLYWLSPSDPDFAGVRIYKSEKDFVIEPISREEILFEGKADGAFDFEAEQGRTYFFSIFAYDHARNYSNPGLLKIAVPFILPEEEFPKPPPEEEKPKPAIPVTPEVKREVKDFYFDFQKKKLVLKMGQPSEALSFEERQFHYLERTPLTIILDERDFPKKPEKMELLLGDVLKYALKKESPAWKIKFETPPVKETFTLTLIVYYQDNTFDTIQLGEILIDPFGYVYKTVFEPYLKLFQKGLWFWEIKERRERLSTVKVTLYVLVEKENWQPWDAEEYNQQNPQITKQEGEFGFMVPKGAYFLEAQKSGFGKKRTPPFEVIDRVVNKNIELAVVTLAWWQIGENLLKTFGLAFAIILFIMIVIGLFKRRRQRQKYALLQTE